MDKCIGSKITVLLKDDGEIEGVLKGFDEFYSRFD